MAEKKFKSKGRCEMAFKMEEDRITGVMFYYYFVCKRKLWYFCHEIQMETISRNENIQLGKLLDETSYNRNQKHINIDDLINIDFIKDYKELHEIKKSKAIEKASIWQVKYYLYYLKKKGVEISKAQIDYPLLKQNIEVNLKNQDIEKIEEIISDITRIKKQKIPEIMKQNKICKKCAYYDICFI